MINLLLLLALFLCFGIVAAWLAENPGSVTIHWFDYRIDTSFAFLLLMMLVLSLAVTFTYVFVRRLMVTPVHFSQARRISRHHKGLAALTHSIAALAAADVKNALTHTRKAEKLLGRSPLTMLLSAQIARSQGDDAKTRALLEQMLGHKETEYVAARSLSEAASKQQMFPKALALAQRAEAANAKGFAAVISLHLRLGQWQEALAAVNRAAWKKQISRADKRRYLGIVYLRQGMYALDNGHKEAALSAARHCIKELPAFAPAVAFTARAFAANDKQDKALRILLSAWKQSPHPQLAETFRSIIAKAPKEKQEKLIRKLTAIHPDTPTPEAAWVCGTCGHSGKTWEVHCPNCSAFDTMEWKQRDTKFVA